MLRLNMSIPPCDGRLCVDTRRWVSSAVTTAGFPNGRRLADDVIDIALQVVEGELIGTRTTLGDGVDEDDKEFSSTFPYVSLPSSGSDPSPHQD